MHIHTIKYKSYDKKKDQFCCTSSSWIHEIMENSLCTFSLSNHNIRLDYFMINVRVRGLLVYRDAGQLNHYAFCFK